MIFFSSLAHFNCSGLGSIFYLVVGGQRLADGAPGPEGHAPLINSIVSWAVTSGVPDATMISRMLVKVGRKGSKACAKPRQYWSGRQEPHRFLSRSNQAQCLFSVPGTNEASMTNFWVT